MYEIKTIDFHKNALEAISKRNQERVDEQVDPSDCALSSWGSSTMISFHRHAIELLETGLRELGREVPCLNMNTLVDADNNVVSGTISSSSFNGKETLSWVLNDEMAEKYERFYIPFGDNSRIQKKFGLKQVRMMQETKPHLVAKCAFIGSGVSFKSVRIDAA